MGIPDGCHSRLCASPQASDDTTRKCVPQSPLTARSNRRGLVFANRPTSQGRLAPAVFPRPGPLSVAVACTTGAPREERDPFAGEQTGRENLRRFDGFGAVREAADRKPSLLPGPVRLRSPINAASFMRATVVVVTITGTSRSRHWGPLASESCAVDKSSCPILAFSGRSGRGSRSSGAPGRRRPDTVADRVGPCAIVGVPSASFVRQLKGARSTRKKKTRVGGRETRPAASAAEDPADRPGSNQLARRLSNGDSRCPRARSRRLARKKSAR